MLYTVDAGENLQQHEYTISDGNFDESMASLTQALSAISSPFNTFSTLISNSETGLTVEPRSPLAIVAQDNQPLYTSEKLPECMGNTPLTNFFFFLLFPTAAL